MGDEWIGPAMGPQSTGEIPPAVQDTNKIHGERRLTMEQIVLDGEAVFFLGSS